MAIRMKIPDMGAADAPTRSDTSAPLRLAVAGEAFGLTVGALRVEAAKGRLVIWRVAGKDWTSLDEIEKMFDRCRIEPKERVSGVDQPDRGARLSDSSRTADTSAALAAARLTLARLKESSRNISPKSAGHAKPR